jgi:hypothetical protein
MAPSESQNQDDGWTPQGRVSFRFAFAYLVIYNLPFPLGILGGSGPYYNLWAALTAWVGRVIFHRTVDVTTPSGSGDTTFAWVGVFCCLILALLTALIWTLIDAKRTHYNRLCDWLRVYVRFVLATAMISYGAAKVVPSQFPAPSLNRLMEPFGDASPMGLLWTFMGASTAYTVFAGAIEMLGGLLLTTRHTTLLGALVCLGALSNVVALNLCYDVPVKLYPINLLLMAAFLALPDMKRLTDFFVRGRATEPTPLRPLFQNRRLDGVARVLRTLLVVSWVAVSLWQSYQPYMEFHDAPRTPLYGIWAVDEWDDNGVAQPPLLTDTSQWRRVVFDYPGILAVQTMPGAWHRYLQTLDPATRTLALSRNSPAWSCTLTYTQPRPNLLTLSGTLDGRQVVVKLHHEDPGKFLLIRRGFHWINELPYNR